VTAAPLPLRVPWAGPAVTWTLRLSPSASLPVRVIPAAVSSAVVTDWASATGASLTDSTAMDTEPVSVACPSLTVKPKLSKPLKLVPGV
jgi:hypothetical protein